MVTVYLTDKKIPFNKAFIQKFDLMIERVTQKNPKADAVFQNEGGEGMGKTTFSCAQAYYIAYKTGRTFSEKNVFLDIKKAIDFAKSTEGQIIIFDEPAKGVLKMQWRNILQQNLIELLMLSRKKRHFIIFNFVKFYKFNEYIVVDRCLAMAHLYEQRNNKKVYAFAYIPKMKLEDLYNDAIKKHQRNYFKYCLFTGEFPDVLNPEKKYNILDSFNYDAYDKEKDRVIATIGDKDKEPNGKERVAILKLRHNVGNLVFPIRTKTDFCKQLGISRVQHSRWAQIDIENIDNNEAYDVTVP
jgi:hypothetical protein